MSRPTLKQKIEEYEKFLHNINLYLTCNNTIAIKQLLSNADDWSYSHRCGNGELSEKEQQELIDKKFWKLNQVL